MSWWTGPEAPPWVSIEWKELYQIRWYQWCKQPVRGQQ
jgi:hypothetical protein